MFAILAKDLYYVAFAFVPFYTVFAILYGGHYLPEAILDITRGNIIIAFAAGALVAFLCFLIRNFLECLVTSAVGAYFVVIALNLILGGIIGGTVATIVIAALSLIGAVVQRFVLYTAPDVN